MEKNILKYFKVFPLRVAGIKTCLHLLQVSTADLLGKEKDPWPELCADENKRERNGITESLVSSDTA